jgi:SAM-dependent methyltransferase
MTSPTPTPSAETIYSCPFCRGHLRFDSSEGHCDSCGKSYPLNDGIPVFTEPDGFYEGKFSHPVKNLAGGYAPPLSWFFSLYQKLNLTGSRQRFLARHLPLDPHAKILDIGCGGGHLALAHRPHVYGLDLSWVSLQKARALYPHVCVGKLEQLPFADESFDLVVGMDLFGHIPPQQKDACLKEIHRVLKPLGRMVLAVECDGDNPLARWAKSFPKIYKQRFIDEDGHVGLEKAGAVLSRLQTCGFVPTDVRGVEQNGHLSHWEFLKRFEGSYEKEEPRIRLEVRRAQFLIHHRLLGALNNLSLGLLENLSRRFLPLDRSNALLVSAQKR